MPSETHWIDDVVPLDGREIILRRPESTEHLLDEERFDRDDEFVPYWADLWPSAERVAAVLSGRALRGARTVELGCGLGLTGIVAALQGGRVLLTDWALEATRAAGINATLNGVEVDTMVVDWRDADALVARGPFDLVLATDVLYEARNTIALLELLPKLIAPGGEALVGDPGRKHAEDFFEQTELVCHRVREGVMRLRPRTD